jgi:hypothetical protein
MLSSGGYGSAEQRSVECIGQRHSLDVRARRGSEIVLKSIVDCGLNCFTVKEADGSGEG